MKSRYQQIIDKIAKNVVCKWSKFYLWGNCTLSYGFWEVFKLFGYVSTETAPPKTAPNGTKRVSPETNAIIGDFGHLKIWPKNGCKSTKIGPNIDFWAFLVTLR